MKLELTAEQRAARAEYRAFAEAELAPFAGQWDRDEALPPEIIQKLAERGWLGTIVPPEHADAALAALHAQSIGVQAVRIGRVVAQHPRMVVMRTHVGGTRVVDLLPGDQLPRIC